MTSLGWLAWAIAPGSIALLAYLLWRGGLSGRLLLEALAIGATLGSAIGFAGGELRRAPVWMRRTGLEWIHRLLNEPRRLFRRYLIHDPPYAARLLAAACVTRVIRKVKNS